MPNGPNGQKRPGDVTGAAIMVAKIATGGVADRMVQVLQDKTLELGQL